MTQKVPAGAVFHPGSWPSIGLIYLFGVLAAASLSKMIPLVGDLGTHLGAHPGQFALLISMMAIAPAVLASVAGSIIDRMGARSALLVAAAIGAGANLLCLLAPSLELFMVARVMEGLVAVGVYSGAPALIMATTSDARRGRAMAFWSTYTPVGISLGLVLGGQWAGTTAWRTGYLVHMVLFGLLLVAGVLLPRSPAAAGGAQKVGLFSAWTQSGPLRLSLTFAMLVMMGLGVSTVYPEWFSRQHGVPVGQASSILGVLNLLMIPGGLLAGWALARGWRDGRLLTLLMLAGAGASLPLFAPGLAEAPRLAALVLWLLSQGAAIAVVTAALPRVVANPLQGAAAAGLLSQLAALVTFVTPLVWQPFLLSGRWPGFLALVAAAAVAALLLFPRRGPAAP